MSKVAKTSVQPAAETYPAIARWVEAHGRVEFGFCHHTRSAIRVLDEGSLVWKGRRSYKSFNAALADCEANIARLLRDDYGEFIV